MDVNDNPPVFNPSVYPIGISESTLAGSAVITVMASDQDIGLNGNITFDITSGDTTGQQQQLHQHYMGTASLPCPYNIAACTRFTAKPVYCQITPCMFCVTVLLLIIIVQEVLLA